MARRRWFAAPVITAFRAEIDRKWLKRDRSSDGIIGDAAHSSRVSDHNPDSRGMVHAVDIDKDGIDVKAVLKAVIGDHRVQYVIWNRRIYSRTYGWRPRVYKGPNPHTHHIHVSFRYGERYENDTSSFLGGPKKPTSGGSDGKRRVIGLETVQKAFREGKKGRSPASNATTKWIQRSLNQMYPHLAPLKVDGVAGRATAKRYYTFEERQGYAKADGVPGRTGLRRLAAATKYKKVLVFA